MFEVSKMSFITEPDGKPRYLFKEEYCSLLDSHIELINETLSKNGISLTIPPLNYNPHIPSGGPINYTFLWLVPLTPTGKVPKYMYTVHFNTFIGDYIKEWGDDTFGEIHYLQNGDIGKVRIIFWRNKALTVIHLKMKEQELLISKIERS